MAVKKIETFQCEGCKKRYKDLAKAEACSKQHEIDPHIVEAFSAATCLQDLVDVYCGIIQEISKVSIVQIKSCCDISRYDGYHRIVSGKVDKKPEVGTCAVYSKYGVQISNGCDFTIDMPPTEIPLINEWSTKMGDFEDKRRKEWKEKRTFDTRVHHAHLLKLSLHQEYQRLRKRLEDISANLMQEAVVEVEKTTGNLEKEILNHNRLWNLSQLRWY